MTIDKDKKGFGRTYGYAKPFRIKCKKKTTKPVKVNFTIGKSIFFDWKVIEIEKSGVIIRMFYSKNSRQKKRIEAIEDLMKEVRK